MPAGSPVGAGRPAVAEHGHREPVDRPHRVEQRPASAGRLLGGVDLALAGQEESPQLAASAVDVTGVDDRHREEHDTGPLALVAEGPHERARAPALRQRRVVRRDLYGVNEELIGPAGQRSVGHLAMIAAHAATQIGRVAAAHRAVELGYGIAADGGRSGRLRHWRVAGIPDEVLELHSKRAGQITAAVAARGTDTYQARNTAARATRAAKRPVPEGSWWPAGGPSWPRSAGRSLRSTSRSTQRRGPRSSPNRRGRNCTGWSAYCSLMTVRWPARRCSPAATRPGRPPAPAEQAETIRAALAQARHHLADLVTAAAYTGSSQIGDAVRHADTAGSRLAQLEHTAATGGWRERRQARRDLPAATATAAAAEEHFVGLVAHERGRLEQEIVNLQVMADDLDRRAAAAGQRWQQVAGEHAAPARGQQRLGRALQTTRRRLEQPDQPTPRRRTPSNSQPAPRHLLDCEPPAATREAPGL